MRSVHAETIIMTRPSGILQAFLEQSDLQAWWGVSRSLIRPVQGGPWTLAWELSPEGMRYVTTGIIEKIVPGEYLKISRMVYLNVDHNFLGPMELEVRATHIDDSHSKASVTQSGYQNGSDWDWYYEAVLQAWPFALDLLKKYLENPGEPVSPEDRKSGSQ